jgi:hypothetical protein
MILKKNKSLVRGLLILAIFLSFNYNYVYPQSTIPQRKNLNSLSSADLIILRNLILEWVNSTNIISLHQNCTIECMWKYTSKKT